MKLYEFDDGDTVEDIFADENVPFVIPCKVTSPKVHVKLMPTDEVTVLSYNETVGFKVVSSAIKKRESISCLYNLRNQSQEQKFKLWVQSGKSNHFLEFYHDFTRDFIFFNVEF